jgi:hypothetical protein
MPSRKRTTVERIEVLVPPGLLLGLTISGGVDVPEGPGVVVTQIKEDGVLGRSGRFRVHDQILSVNGETLDNMTHADIIAIIERARLTGKVVFEIQRTSTHHRASLQTRMRYPALPFHAMACFDWHATEPDQLDLQVLIY